MKQYEIYGSISSSSQDYPENQTSLQDILSSLFSANNNNTKCHISVIHKNLAIDEQFNFAAEVAETLTFVEEVRKPFNEALKEPSWVTAREAELQLLKDKTVWDLVEL